MSATARAEARRKAILSRGSDRLSRLTTSARGDDPAYKLDDPPLPKVGIARPTSSSHLKTDAFLGENTPSMPVPNRTSSFTRADSEPPFTSGPTPDPSVWSAQQQAQIMAALMGGAGVGGAAFPGLPGMPASDPTADPPLPELGSGVAGDSNPLAALLSQQGFNGGTPSTPPFVEQPAKPKTLLQKILPVIHVFAMLTLFGYFAFWYEPNVYEVALGGNRGVLERWAELAKSSEKVGAAGEKLGYWVMAIPFFTAFVTLQLVLHSLRIFSGHPAPPPPKLLSLALPFLPAPLPSVIMQGLKYLDMGGAVIDDFALLVVLVGLSIAWAQWKVSS